MNLEYETSRSMKQVGTWNNLEYETAWNMKQLSNTLKIKLKKHIQTQFYLHVDNFTAAATAESQKKTFFVRLSYEISRVNRVAAKS